MTLADLTPDASLANLLNKKVEVQTSATSKYAIEAYKQAEMPNTGLADEFITVQVNGVTRSLTRPLGCFKGYLALTIYCKSNPNGTAKSARIKQMVSKCVELADRKTSDGFFFEFDPTNVITPTTVNLTTGYATKTLNVAWHTT